MNDTASFEVKLPPRFIHDCKSCLYLGRHEEYDMWFCPTCDEGTLIARYDNEGGEYASTPLFCLRPEHIKFLQANPDYRARQAFIWALEQPEIKANRH
jgi:hypothetical protein